MPLTNDLWTDWRDDKERERRARQARGTYFVYKCAIQSCQEVSCKTFTILVDIIAICRLGTTELNECVRNRYMSEKEKDATTLAGDKKLDVTSKTHTHHFISIRNELFYECVIQNDKSSSFHA